MEQKVSFSELLIKLMPQSQLKAMQGVKEHADAIDRMNKKALEIPLLGKTDGWKKHPLALHYFTSSCDWYICEWDRDDRFFGYAILNNDLDCSEWGYISRYELLSLGAVLGRRGDLLNLDCYCSYKTIEEALYKRDPKYFSEYGGE